MRSLIAFVAVLVFGLIALQVGRKFATWPGGNPIQIDGHPEEEAPPVEPTPHSLRFLQRRHDFGRVLQGDIAEHRFEFEVVRDPVVLDRLTASCGCVDRTVQVWRAGAWENYEFGSPLAPGTRGSVWVRVETAARNIRESSRVHVKSSDRGAPDLRLDLSMELVRLFRLEPERVEVRGFVRREGVTRTLRLSPVDAERVVVEKVSKLPKGWTLQLHPGANDAFVDIEVKAMPQEGQPYVQGRVTLHARSSAATGLRPVYLSVVGGALPDVLLEPKILMFPEVEAGQGHRFATDLTVPDSQMELWLEDVRLESEDDTGLDVEVTTLIDGRHYRVELIVRPERAPGRIRGSIWIRHNLSSEEQRVGFAGAVGTR